MEGATDDTSSKYIMVDSADFLLMNYWLHMMVQIIFHGSKTSVMQQWTHE
jgi:hypothetical protein